jgi:hypothetical protein
MLTPKARHIRRTSWTVTSLEAGIALFLVGLVLLYSNPFWHFDDSGLLDWRVHWWNAAGQILVAAGFVTEALALVAAAAVLLSRCFSLRLWPYTAAALLVCCAVGWVLFDGAIRDFEAQFEWDAGGGFSGFRLERSDGHQESNPIWRSVVEVQIQPLLRGYFKLNDWQKMNGNIGIKVARIVPVAWPVGLGAGGEGFDDPDQTALMRAAAQQDLKTLQQLLTAASRADVNALDQGGQTALILACQNSKANPAVIKALLVAGADVNLRARNGYAALTWALARNNSDVVRLLRRAGARP